MDTERKEKLQPTNCYMCQPARDIFNLKAGKGMFKDFDSDLSYGIPVCGGCGGLGVQYPTKDFEDRTAKIMDLRFKYCPIDEEAREDLTEEKKLGIIKSLVAEIKDLVTNYGDSNTKDSFAYKVATGGLSGIVEEIEGNVQLFAEMRKVSADPVAEALREPSIAYIEGRIKTAESGFKEAIANFPDSSLVYHDYGVFLAEAKHDLNHAYDNFSKSVDLEPRKALHAYQAGKCAVALGKYTEAINWLTAAKQTPDCAEIEKDQEISIDRIIEDIGELLINKRSAFDAGNIIQ